MSTKAALFTKGRPAAIRTASEWSIPGLDPDDVRQEALVALWAALGTYDPSKSTVPSFARMVSERRCRDLLRNATRQKRTAPLGSPPNAVVAPDTLTIVLHRQQLAFALTDPRIERRRRWRDAKRNQRVNSHWVRTPPGGPSE